MYHLDLFSGIGGFFLACQWAGIETISFVEIDKYCQKVLRKHWPEVPIVEDIRDVEKIKEIVANATQSESPMDGRILCASESGQSRRSNSSRDMGCQPRGEHRLGIGWQVEPQPTILITAGFPCQPFSVAGKQQGERDDRYLWPETLAVIKVIKPHWVLLENVTGIINLALDTVLSDLEGASYSTETLIIPACAVNAPHRRDRIWIVAYSEGTGTWQDNGGIRKGISGIDRRQESVIPDPAKFRCKGNERLATRQRVGQAEKGTYITESDWWTVEPELGRVAHGIPNRVDRLKCLGNAIVPQVAYEIIRAIKEIDEQTL